MEGLLLLKKMLLPGDFMCKIVLKDTFCGSIVKKLPEICQFPMEKSIIPIFMSILWTLFSAISLHQINESSNTDI